VDRCLLHSIKGFVIPTKSFVKIGIPKIFCYNNKMFSSINKTFGCCSKNFGCSDKKNICSPQFCCRYKTIFFPVVRVIGAGQSKKRIDCLKSAKKRDNYVVCSGILTTCTKGPDQALIRNVRKPGHICSVWIRLIKPFYKGNCLL